jgi:hypothetical protein
MTTPVPSAPARAPTKPARVSGARAPCTFYLDPFAGNTVTNNGLTPETAWGPLWTVLKSKVLVQGDELVLARGYHGKLMFLASPAPAEAPGEKVTAEMATATTTATATAAATATSSTPPSRPSPSHVTIRPVDGTHVPVFASVHFALGVSNWHLRGHAIVCDGFRPLVRNGKEPWGVVTRCGIPWSFGVTVAKGCTNILLQGLTVMSATAPAWTGVSIDGRQCTLQDVHVTGGHGIVLEQNAEGVVVTNCVVERPVVGHGISIGGSRCVVAGAEVLMLPQTAGASPQEASLWETFPVPTWLPALAPSSASGSGAGASHDSDKLTGPSNVLTASRFACVVTASTAMDGTIVSSRFIGGGGIGAPTSVTVSGWVICNNVVIGALGIDLPKAVKVDVVHNTIASARTVGVVLPITSKPCGRERVGGEKGSLAKTVPIGGAAPNVVLHNRVVRLDTDKGGATLDVQHVMNMCAPPPSRVPCITPSARPPAPSTGAPPTAAAQPWRCTPYIHTDALARLRPADVARVDAGAFQAVKPVGTPTPGADGRQTTSERMRVRVMHRVDVADSVSSAQGLYVAWDMPAAASACRVAPETRWFADQTRWPVTVLRAKLDAAACGAGESHASTGDAHVVIATCRTGATTWFVPCADSVAASIEDTIVADVSWPTYLGNSDAKARK